MSCQCYKTRWKVFSLNIAGVGRSKELDQYIGSGTGPNRSFSCNICYKDFVRRDHVINHLESLHFPNSYNHTCHYCGDAFNTKNKLYKHNFKFHKEACWIRFLLFDWILIYAFFHVACVKYNCILYSYVNNAGIFNVGCRARMCIKVFFRKWFNLFSIILFYFTILFFLFRPC